MYIDYMMGTNDIFEYLYMLIYFLSTHQFLEFTFVFFYLILFDILLVCFNVCVRVSICHVWILGYLLETSY
jgi:hypothetical protein